MANLKQALQWLAEGKQVRSLDWDTNEFIVASDDGFIDENGEPCRIKFIHFDFEIYSPPLHRCEQQSMICYKKSPEHTAFHLTYLPTRMTMCNSCSHCPFCGEKA